MRLLRILVAAVLFSVALMLPCAAQTLQGDVAYQELLKVSDPSSIVAINGKRYVRAPQGADRLPGGYSGGYGLTKVRLPKGQEVEVIDPAKPLNISKGGKSGEPQVPDRVRRIVAALEKIGLHTGLNALPLAIRGHRIDSLTTEKKPGGTFTWISIHVGAEDQISKLFEPQRKALAERKFLSNRADPFAPTPPWPGVIYYPIDPNLSGGGPVMVEHETYMSGSVWAVSIKREVMVSVAIHRYDSQTATQLDQPLAGAPYERVQRLHRAREIALAATVRPQVENWMKILVKLVDDTETASAPVAVAKPPEPKPPEPKPPPPSIQPAKPPSSSEASLATGRSLMAKPPRPLTVIGPRIERFVREQAQWAAANPVKAAGTVMMGVGVALLGTFTAPWSGTALIVGGIGAYQSTKPREPPAEFAAIREAREKIKKYQEEWKQGFSDAELNELGIFLDDLSKLTREQRTKVYRDADIEFKNKAEVWRDIRQAEEKERGSAGR